MGLSQNWNVTGMYDKLLVEGILLHVMSVKCGICSQRLKGCTETRPRPTLDLCMIACFLRGSKGYFFNTVGQILPRLEEASLWKEVRHI